MVKFIYSQSTEYAIEWDVNIPFNGCLEELSYFLIEKFGLPIYLYDELYANLSDFIASNNRKYRNEKGEEAIGNGRNREFVEEVIKKWEVCLKEEMSEFGDKRCASDEELFATAYHKMVHSPALETILRQEHHYAESVRKRVRDTDDQISSLSDCNKQKDRQDGETSAETFGSKEKKSQTEQMSRAVAHLGDVTTEFTINELATQHFEDQTLLSVQLNSEIDTIKEAQKREYRAWLMSLMEQKQTTSSILTPNSPLAPKLPSLPRELDETAALRIDNPPIMEESFTIHLGSQLKQMHNIRVLSANIMDFCEAAATMRNMTSPILEKTQTALCLYSNDLSGVVLMADNIIGSRLNKEFRDICQRTTEFHFSNIDAQLERIQVLLTQVRGNANSSRSKHLRTGDCYITRHSNLAQEHVVFHMVVDDTLRGSDINSRHPVVLGLRNVLKTACANDVTTITVPLLLSYEMGEEMTVLWCEKRAELVYKCVKGFMIEMASWGGSDLKNLQFMLPPGISSEVFQGLTEMLPRIFKVSNPLILQTSNKY